MQMNKKQIKEHFNSIAATYDGSKHVKIMAKCFPYLLNTIQNIRFNNILDVGCGTGELLQQVVSADPSVKAYGIDLAAQMIEEARKKVSKKVDLQEGDAEMLPYERGQFQLVVMNFSFQYFHNPVGALKEAHRVMKKGGKLVIADENKASGFAKIKKIVNNDIGNLYTFEEIKKMLMEAGFEYITCNKAVGDTYIATCDKR